MRLEGLCKVDKNIFNLSYTPLWGFRVEEKLYLGVRKQKMLNAALVEQKWFRTTPSECTSETITCLNVRSWC
jgi:hypothetical protein